MQLLGLAWEIIAVSATGVMAPGPLTAVVAGVGARRGWTAGFLAAVGHSVVELPLVIALSIGVVQALESSLVRSALGLAGGTVLIVLGIMQLRAEPAKEAPQSQPGQAMVAGAAMTGLNPYFILWWLSVGAKLISDTISLVGLAGIPMMFALHIWMDYVWLAFIAHLARRGASISPHAYKVINVLLGAFMLYFGARFILDALGV